MTIPPIPQFNKPKKHVTQKQLAKEIRQAILKIRTVIKGSQTREILSQLAGYVSAGFLSIDIDRLPVHSPNGKTKRKNKTACVLALASQLVTSYWGYCQSGNPNLDTLKRRLEKVMLIVERGVNSFKIIGDDAKGYMLEVK